MGKSLFGDWSTVMVRPSEFRFSEDTPLADMRVSLGGAVVFLVTVAIAHRMMKGRPAMSLTWFSNAHNLFLSVLSGVMHVGIIYGVYEKYILPGRPLMEILCDTDENPMHGTLAFWCWVYYLSKYVEYIDTLLMVVKHKPLTVLHVWHHFVIGPMSLSWLKGGWMLHFYGALFNTAVHVAMYWYYFSAKAFGSRPWWRVWLTTAQITQFFSVFFMIWLFVWYYVQSPVTLGPVPADGFLPSLEFTRGCSGDPWTIVFAQFVNITFLILFINFYIQTYTKAKAKKAAAKAAKSS